MISNRKWNVRKSFIVCLFSCIAFFSMYYEFCGAILTVVLAGMVLIYFRDHSDVTFEITLGSILYTLFLCGYILTCFYGIDAGMSVFGVVKILWIAPFLLLYQQLEKPAKTQLFDAIPMIGTVVVIIGFLALLFPRTRDFFWVNHRLGGTFQYPNTFAIFLLMGVILLIYRQGSRWMQTVEFIVLCLGIAATGSRIGMALSVVSIGVLLLIKKRWKLLGISLLMAVVGSVYIYVSGDSYTVGRILRLSLAESTLVGRFLYAYDAAGLLLRHPFGMGYLGYYYIQNQVQTGLYTVRFVHNDLLQIGLDIGWIPMLTYVGAIIGCLKSKAVSSDKKWIVVVLFLHGLLDFDLSYTVMFCILLLILDDISLTKCRGRIPGGITIKKSAFRIGAGVLICVNIYLAIPPLAEYCDNAHLASTVYPWYTEANLRLLSESDDIDEVEQLADRILRQNDTCALTYYAKAYAAYCVDDYSSVITYQKACIARDYFNYEEYLNYARMLYDGMYGAEDETERQLCRKELQNIPDLLAKAQQKLSALGRQIADQPELEVDEYLQEMIDEAG